MEASSRIAPTFMRRSGDGSPICRGAASHFGSTMAQTTAPIMESLK